MSIQVFGGGKINIVFDARTRVDRDGQTARARDLKPGDRVYVETVLDHTETFARRIHVVTKSPQGQCHGQLVDYLPEKGELRVRDELSSEVVRMRLNPNSIVLQEGKTVPASELQKGDLVSVEFLPSNAHEPVIGRLLIIATPGATFSFSGRVSHLDLHIGLLVLLDPRVDRTYEIRFDPLVVGRQAHLHEGADVTVNATFDGMHYTAKSIVINPSPSEP